MPVGEGIATVGAEDGRDPVLAQQPGQLERLELGHVVCVSDQPCYLKRNSTFSRQSALNDGEFTVGPSQAERWVSPGWTRSHAWVSALP